MSSGRRLHRPKSAAFDSAEHPMKRITNFFNSSESRLPRADGPPTPPLAPDVSGAGFSTFDGRPRTPLSVNTSSVASRYTLAPPESAFGSALTPTSSGATLPFLQALPPSPGIASSRPGTASEVSAFGSRPGTPSGFGLSPGILPASGFHKLRKKHSRYNSQSVGLAWKLIARNFEGKVETYDCGPLLRGERTMELWNEDGDTLVYLTSRDSTNTKYANPVFRIHSCPAMFSCLGPYIIDNHAERNAEGRGRRPSSEGLLDMAAGEAAVDGIMERPAIPGRASSSSAISSTNSAQYSPGHAITRVSLDRHTPQRAEIVNEDEDDVFYKIYYPVADEDGSRPVTPLKGKQKKPKHTKTEAEGSLQRFIDARNLFAFFSQTYLVASKARDVPFDVLVGILGQLNLNDSDQSPGDMNFTGKAVDAQRHLEIYINTLGLDDVRNDDDGIIETLILGEKWQSQKLYHEAFIHAAGRWGDISDHLGLSMVTQTTKNRLDRAFHDLENIRLVNIHDRITDFDFPSVWVGEGRYPDYKSWRHGYDRMRTLVLNHEKHVFGSWPPKAGKVGKGRGTSRTGGLNRVVLKRLYDDLCCVYDLTVDREWLHGERIHFEGTQGGSDSDESNETKDRNERHRNALRKILCEFDKCSVPVQPEMPFDLPRLPYRLRSATKKKKLGIFSKSNKKIREEEISGLLKNSYNQDSYQQYARNELVKAFIEMEKDFGTSKPIEELIGARRGAWVFIYCVLQTLVMGVVDGQGLRHGEDVEYFLCENVKGTPPWEKGANRRQTRMSGKWTVGGDNGLGPLGMHNALGSTLNLNPDDEIDMTYRRSHCWVAAEDWRLVRAAPNDDYRYGEEYSEGRSSSSLSNEYVPGLQIPQSPTLEPPISENLVYTQQFTPTEHVPRLQLDGPELPHAHYQSYHNNRSTSPLQPPLHLTPVDEVPQHQFDFDLSPPHVRSAKTSPSRSRSASPVRPRAWSPSATQRPICKSSAPVSGTSSPLRHGNPALAATTTLYSAYNSPAESPILGPQHNKAATLSRRL